MKRLIIGVLMSLAFLNGIRIVMAQDATIADYEGLVGQAAAEMIQFRETWGDDDFFAVSRTGDAYTLQRINGQDAIIMGPVPGKDDEGEKDRRSTDSYENFPVLGIHLGTPPGVDYRLATDIGVLYPLSLDPSEETSFSNFMDVDTDWMTEDSEDEIESSAQEVFRLEEIGVGYPHPDRLVIPDRTSSIVYDTPKADNIIFTRELAYRNLWDPFGNLTQYGPVIFTCGDYVLQTDDPYETYAHPIHTSTGRTDTHTATITIDGQVIASGSHVYDRPYGFEFVESFSSLYTWLRGDFWPEEEIARCCYPDGPYELWERTPAPWTVVGTDVFLDWGLSVPTGVYDDEERFSACTYAHYVYPGHFGYDYELRFWAGTKSNNREWVIASGSQSSEGDEIPDDVTVESMKIYDFLGKPVVVISLFRAFWHKPHYTQWFIYYNNELYPTATFVTDMWATTGRSDINGSIEKHGAASYGNCIALGVLKSTVTYE